jgi:regulator of telomere elongation helicase 1
VINPNQIWVGALEKATNGAVLSSTFENRSTDYERGLGLTLSNICRIIPDGVLVFFPSYKLLEDCLKTWREPVRLRHQCHDTNTS